MKATLVKINIKETDKDGNPYLDKNSRPYKRVGIQIAEKPDTWIGGLAYQGSPMLQWKVGDVVEIDEPKQNGKYWNFNLPRTDKSVSKDFIYEKLVALEKKVDRILQMMPSAAEKDEELPITDLPF